MIVWLFFFQVHCGLLKGGVSLSQGVFSVPEPDRGEFVPVVMTINNADEDVENE